MVAGGGDGFRGRVLGTMLIYERLFIPNPLDRSPSIPLLFIYLHTSLVNRCFGWREPQKGAVYWNTDTRECLLKSMKLWSKKDKLNTGLERGEESRGDGGVILGHVRSCPCIVRAFPPGHSQIEQIAFPSSLGRKVHRKHKAVRGFGSCT